MSSKVVSAPLKAVPKAGAPPKAAAQKAAIVKYVPCAAPGTISGAVLAKVVSRQQGAQGLRKAGVLKISTVDRKGMRAWGHRWRRLQNKRRLLRLCTLLLHRLIRLQSLCRLQVDQMMTEWRFVRCLEWHLCRRLPPLRQASCWPKNLSQLCHHPFLTCQFCRLWLLLGQYFR
jgi:hypothetical protein